MPAERPRHHHAGDAEHPLPLDLTKFKPLSVERFHLEAEAARIAYMMREQYIGDPAQVHVDVAGILAKEFAEEHIKNIKMDRLLDLPNVAPPMNPSTVYITVVDKDRNVCSFINSIAPPSARRSSPTRPASCCRTAPAVSGSSQAIRTASRRASGRCTPSFRALRPRTAAP